MALCIWARGTSRFFSGQVHRQHQSPGKASVAVMSGHHRRALFVVCRLPIWTNRLRRHGARGAEVRQSGSKFRWTCGWAGGLTAREARQSGAGPARSCQPIHTTMLGPSTAAALPVRLWWHHAVCRMCGDQYAQHMGCMHVCGGGRIHKTQETDFSSPMTRVNLSVVNVSIRKLSVSNSKSSVTRGEVCACVSAPCSNGRSSARMMR